MLNQTIFNADAVKAILATCFQRQSQHTTALDVIKGMRRVSFHRESSYNSESVIDTTCLFYVDGSPARAFGAFWVDTVNSEITVKFIRKSKTQDIKIRLNRETDLVQFNSNIKLIEMYKKENQKEANNVTN